MPQFLIDGYFVNANDLETAKEIYGIFAEQKHDRILLIQKGNEKTIIKLDDVPTKIYTLYKKTISYCGEVKVGAGEKILESAIQSVQVSKEAAAKFAVATKKANIENRHKLEKKDIVAFESLIPGDAKLLYSSIMMRIGATTDAYRLEIIEGLVGCEIKPETWMPILVWFKEKVLDTNDAKELSEKQTLFMLRKSFVTAALRIGKTDARHANTMKHVANDGRGKVDWLKYAQESNGGG